MRRAAASVAGLMVVGLVVAPAVVAVADEHLPGGTVVDASAIENASVAAQIADIYDHRVEITSEQTENSTTYVNPDGTRTTTLWTGPVRAENADGELVPIDLTLRETEDGAVRPVAAAVDTSFTTGGDQPLASVDLEHGRELALDWPTALPAPTLDGNKATYRLDPTTSLVLTATKLGFNAHIVLSAAPTDSAVFRLPLQLAQLFAHEGEDGGIVLDNPSGEPVAAAGNFVMWDATRDVGGDPANLHDVASHVDGGGSAPTLVLDPSDAWLNDPATQYPVTIDPDLTNLQQDGDTFVFVNQSATNYRYSDYNLGVGPWQQTAANTAKTYLNWNLSAVPTGAYVTSANVRLQQYYAPTCSVRAVNMHPLLDNDSNAGNDNFLVSTFNDDNRPTSDDGASSSTSASGNTGASGCANTKNGTNFTIGATALAREWVTGARTNAGIALNVPNANKNDVSYEKRFCSMNSFENTSTTYCNQTDDEPQLDISYETVPGAPAAVNAVMSAGGTSATVSWTAATPYAAPVTNYYVYRTPGNVEVTSAGAGLSKVITGLTAGTAYKFRVRAQNAKGFGSYSAYTPEAPVGVTAVAEDQSGSVSWDDPGAVPSGGYSISTVPATSTTSAPSTTTDVTVGGLTNGTSYTMNVKAIAGSNWASAPTAAFVPAAAPGAPTGVTATAVSGGQSTVSWTAPAATGGSAVTSYTVETTDGTFLEEVASPATTLTANGLLDGTTYQFVVTASNGVTTGPPSYLSSADASADAAQTLMGQIADRIEGVGLATPPPDLTNYAGIIDSPDTATMTLYWKGAVPSSVITRMGSTTGVTVNLVENAPYSSSDLTAADNRLRDEVSTSFDPIDGVTDAVVTKSAPRPDGQGLDVTFGSPDLYTKSAWDHADVPVPTTVSATTVAAAVGADAGVPVFAEPTDVVPVTADNRTNDTGDLTGGAYMYHPVAGGTAMCTIGFGITTYNGKAGALTAAHCGNTTWYNGGRVLGTVTGYSTVFDNMVIQTKQNTTRSIFYGKWGTSNKRKIWGAMSVKKGDKVCTSGSQSGKHCKIVVAHANTTVDVNLDGTVRTFYGQGDGNAAVGKNAAAGGDSGGPVISFDANTGKMKAVGTISSGSSELTCKGTRAVDGVKTCGRYVTWANIGAAMYNMGATLRHY